MDILHLDYETYSDADLKKVGAFRYANDPSTVILCAAIALNDEEPLTWVDGAFSSPKALELFLRASREPDLCIYAHNAMFEIAVTDALWRKTFNLAPPQHMQWRCTAAMARKAALPAALERVALKLNLSQQKDSKGKSLINKFCKLQKPTKKRPAGGRLMPAEDPAAFAEFVAYCVQDVRTEQAVHQKLKAFEWKGSSLDMFQLDIAINTRGLPVNIEGLKVAQELVDLELGRVSAEFRALTGFEPTQGGKFLVWLKERGYKGENLRSDTLEEELELNEEDMICMEPKAREALLLKQRVGFAAIKKIPTMLAWAMTDGRIRGTHICHGPTTGRWAGSGPQPHNFKRPTIDNTEQAYGDICAGMSAEDLEMFYGSPLDVLSSCMRHFINDVRGGVSHDMLDADYASIEGRIVCWLAGQLDAIEEYRLGLDRYKIMASVIFNKPVDQITKDERLIGKYAVLGCGYGMGPPKFRITTEMFGYKNLTNGLEYIAVAAFRKKHYMLSRYSDENGENAGLWQQAEQSCLNAIRNPGNKYHIGPHCRAFSARTAGMHCLFIMLPSGRALCYPEAAIEKKLIPGKPAGTGYRLVDGVIQPYATKAVSPRLVDQITFYGNIKGVTWGRCSTFGASIVENLTQAVAADIMANGACNAERAGYEIAALIHDEALAYYAPERGQSIGEFITLLTTLPRWADGLPIEAEGDVVKFYKK